MLHAHSWPYMRTIYKVSRNKCILKIKCGSNWPKRHVRLLDYWLWYGCHCSLCLQAIFLFHLLNYKPLTYNNVYVYPWWGEVIGWCLALSSMLCIPISLLYKLSGAKGTFKEVCTISTDSNHCSISQHIRGVESSERAALFMCIFQIPHKQQLVQPVQKQQFIVAIDALELDYGSVTSLKSIRITHEKAMRVFIVTRLMVVIPLQIDHNASPPQCLLPNSHWILNTAEVCGMYVWEN